MAYTLSSNSLPDISETVQFSETITVTGDGDPLISNIYVIATGDATNGPTVSVNLTANSFTISGNYIYNFSTTINYLDSKSVSQTASKFTEIPSDFLAVYKYTPSSVSSASVYYEVNVNGNLIGNVSQTVLNNYNVGRDNLKTFVTLGKF